MIIEKTRSFYASDCRKKSRLRALIQNLYQELDRKFHLNGATDNFWIWHGFSGILYKATSATGTWPREHRKCIRLFLTLFGEAHQAGYKKNWEFWLKFGNPRRFGTLHIWLEMELSQWMSLLKDSARNYLMQ